MVDECEYEGIDELKSDVLYSVFGTNYDDGEIGVIGKPC